MTANGMPTPIILSVTADRSSWPLNCWCKEGKERKSQLNKTTWRLALGVPFARSQWAVWVTHLPVLCLGSSKTKFNLLMVWICPLIVEQLLCALQHMRSKGRDVATMAVGVNTEIHRGNCSHTPAPQKSRCFRWPFLFCTVVPMCQSLPSWFACLITHILYYTRICRPDSLCECEAHCDLYFSRQARSEDMGQSCQKFVIDSLCLVISLIWLHCVSHSVFSSLLAQGSCLSVLKFKAGPPEFVAFCIVYFF